MNCLKNYSGITWSVLRRLRKLSFKSQVSECLDWMEFSTKTFARASVSCSQKTLGGLDFSNDTPHQNGVLFKNRLVGTCNLLTSHNIGYYQKRFKSMKGQGRSGKNQQMAKKETRKKDEAEDDDDDEVDVSDVVEDKEIPAEDDPTLPQIYKHRTVYVKTIRADTLISAGLSFSRNRTDEVFYSSLLRLNGEKLLKKSRKVSVGDYVDFIVKKDPGMLKVQRVKLVKINAEKTGKDKYVLTLRIWKAPFDVAVMEEKTKFEPRKF